MSENGKSSNTEQREFTIRALILGLLMTLVLGGANAYLGLRAGMTIAATYPAAVIGMAVLRLMRGSLLEENFARTVGSVGESVAAGAIFTIPAFVIAGLWTDFGSLTSYLLSSAMMFCGGLLGILFVALLRRVMVEDQELPFPESTAAAEIHIAGRRGGSGAKLLFTFMGIGALVQIMSKLSVFASSKTAIVGMGKTSIAMMTGKMTTYKQIDVLGATSFSTPEVAPAYMGVGFIIGPRLAALNFAGGVLAWGLFVPLLAYVLGPSIIDTVGLQPDGADGGVVSWATLAGGIWKFFVRPIAVGGMLVGAGYTLFKMRNSLLKGLGRAVGDVRKAATQKTATERVDRDLDFRVVFGGIAFVAISMVFLYYYFCGSWGGALMSTVVMVITGFFFAAVSGFLVGTIGSSNNPVSGLTVSTLIIAALLMVAVGVKGDEGVAAVLGVAAVICVSSAVAGEMLQDLKAGHILRGTPWKMELGNIIGVVVASFTLFFPLLMLHQGGVEATGEGFGGKQLPAPQAGLMAMLAGGIVGGEMAWPLVIVGMLMGVALILVQVKSPMLVAVGMYLPFETTFAIFCGGIARWALDAVCKRRGYNEAQMARIGNAGVLVAAGLIAGEALTGLAVGGLSYFQVDLPQIFTDPSWILGLAILVGVGYLMVRVPTQHAGDPNDAAPPAAVV
ncbi:MAG: oligopeptide transporter, OPT family [Myxococcota bacterium]|jgi:putative OPT family oligopeptide transporter|nr:oligopeptide transporter, OPT family [Myxococcota bacterium]